MNLRKAWRVAKSTRPHAVIFLGDMMDNGFAEMSMAECVPGSQLPATLPHPFSLLRLLNERSPFFIRGSGV